MESTWSTVLRPPSSTQDPSEEILGPDTADMIDVIRISVEVLLPLTAVVQQQISPIGSEVNNLSS